MIAPPTQSLKIYKLFDEAHLPIYGTKWSACFDLSASIREQDEVTIMGASNLPTKRKLTDGFIPLYAGERCLVPTGLIFDLDHNQSLRIHPRSGLAWKQGISIANCEGVVDAELSLIALIHRSLVVMRHSLARTAVVAPVAIVCMLHDEAHAPGPLLS